MADVSPEQDTNGPRSKIAIADKNPVVRAGLKEFIERDQRFDVIDVLPTGGDLLALADRQPIDIAVIGWSLPDITGGDVLAALKRQQSQVRVIIYTGEPGKDVLRQSVRLGAWGFISKSDEPDVLVEALASVARGRMSLPYVDLQTLTQDPLGELTARERELLTALANGWTNLQIAARIGISRNTVKYHLKNLYDKLGVNNRAMAVALYVSATRDAR